MEKETIIPINLQLFGETYKLKASAQQEGSLRKFAQIANKYFEEHKKNYPGGKDREYLSMAIISLFSELANDEGVADLKIAEQVDKIDRLLH
jgi:hypothetical protein